MRTALRWLAKDLGPLVVSTATVCACVYGFTLLAMACSQRSHAINIKPRSPVSLGEVKLQGVEVNCDVARDLQPVLDEELENIKIQIRIITEGRTPNLAEEPILIVLGHQWKALHDLDSHLKSFVVESGCGAA